MDDPENGITLHLDRGFHPLDIHQSGQPTHPCDAFLVLARVPGNTPHAIMRLYGSSDFIGNLLMTLFQRSITEYPEMAAVMEDLAREIVKYVDEAKGKEWGDLGLIGNA